MPPPGHKTKIVATLGPASADRDVMEAMLRAGMNVARLNFSHGDFDVHARLIAGVREAARRTGHDVTIMADLPGPKMRLGPFVPEAVQLEAGREFTLTTADVPGDGTRVSVSFGRLPAVVRPGDKLYLNDGLVQLEVLEAGASEVRCRVTAGGELRSRKSLNLPGIDVGVSAFTPADHACLRFALEHGVDAVSQSFVQSAADVGAVREAAAALGHAPFVIAKIERAGALEHIEPILQAADGIMIARGDLGVEVPIERIAILQKELLRKAQRAGKPAITATQMLESMLHSRQPTRAEATDVANAILDGTDCVMLSGESAMGRHPVEAVATLARIAAATEPHRSRESLWRRLEALGSRADLGRPDLISLSVEAVIEHGPAAAVVVPTRTGNTPRAIARFRLPVWILAATEEQATARHLAFSYGVIPQLLPRSVTDWAGEARRRLADLQLDCDLALLVQGPSAAEAGAEYSLRILPLERQGTRV